MDSALLDSMYKHEHSDRLKVFSIDIETFTLGKKANEYTNDKSYRLGNVKDPDKVKAALAKKKEEAARKHALSWWTGKIVSVAVVDVYSNSGDEVCFAGHDEASVLKELAVYLNTPCKLVGKSSEMFDYGFLRGRYMANRLNIPRVLKQQNNLLDCDKFLAFSSQSSQRGTLADYAFGLGLEGKTMKGSDVAELYERIMMTESVDKIAAAKLWDELIEYNLQDARIVAEMTRLYYGTEGGAQ